jgi:hypothetical protein
MDVRVDEPWDHSSSAEIYDARPWASPKANFSRGTDGNETAILDRHAFFNGKILIDGEDFAVSENYIGASACSGWAPKFHFLFRARKQAYP